MRNFINIVYHPFIINSHFLDEIRSHMHISWLDDFSNDDVLISEIDQLMKLIRNHGALDSGGVVVWRWEMRKQSDLRNLKSIGCFWSWDQDRAAVFVNFDMSKLTKAVFNAYADNDIIDWPKTIARNLTNPDEREISIKGPFIKVSGYYDKNGMFHDINRKIEVRVISDEPAPK